MESHKLLKQTHENFLTMFQELITEETNTGTERPSHNPDRTLRVLDAYFDDILTVASCSAIFAYHNQLREELKKQGIDIGEFDPEDVNL